MSETRLDLVGFNSVPGVDVKPPAMRRGTAMIFHILPTDEFLFFRRDKEEDKPGLPNPDRVCLIGGGRKDGETPEQTIRREVGNELFEVATNLPFEMDEIEHVATLHDNRPGVIDVFAHPIDHVPSLYIIEGQGLVVMSRQETLQTDFPYGFNETIYNYVRSNPVSYFGGICLDSAAMTCVSVPVIKS